MQLLRCNTKSDIICTTTIVNFRRKAYRIQIQQDTGKVHLWYTVFRYKIGAPCSGFMVYLNLYHDVCLYPVNGCLEKGMWYSLQGFYIPQKGYDIPKRDALIFWSGIWKTLIFKGISWYPFRGTSLSRSGYFDISLRDTLVPCEGYPLNDVL